MRAATATTSSLLILALLLLSLATPAWAETETPVSALYRIKVNTKDLDLTLTYGFIVMLGGNLFTAFVIEEGKYRCACDSDGRRCIFSYTQAAELLSISLVQRVYTCHEVGDGIIVGNRPEKNIAYVVRISGSMIIRHTTDTVEISVSEEPRYAGGGGGGNPLDPIFKIFEAVLDFLNSAADGLKMVSKIIMDSIRVLMAAMDYAGNVFEAFIAGLRALGSWIGSPGDPIAMYFYNAYKTELTILSTAYQTKGTVIEEVLECKRPIRDALHLISTGPSIYVDLTLCELEKRQPSGIVGTLVLAFLALINAGGIVFFIANNFTLMNIAIVVLFFLEGVYGSIRRMSLAPLERAIKRIVKLFTFYWRAITFVAELVLKIVNTIMSLGSIPGTKK